jgi:flagellar basal-body rod modification protein FlgD
MMLAQRPTSLPRLNRHHFPQTVASTCVYKGFLMDISPLQPDLTTTASSNRQISSDFETFLKMLTTQIQNQDPLNPVDSSDYAVQLATFSSVEQQVQTNDLLRALQGQFGSSGIAEMADWVGKEARSSAPVFVDGSPITLYPTIESGAERAAIVIRNESGDDVGQIAVPTDGAPVEWAGVTADGFPFPPGRYTFDVQSFSGDDLIGSTPAQTYGAVTEVRRGASGDTVIVLSNNVEVSAADVTALRAAS